MIAASLMIFLTVASASMKPQIVGGMPALKGELPFQISLQDSTGSAICGGSLIKKDWVLTAAHCVDDWAKKNKVVVGLLDQSDRTGTETFTAKKVISHPQYSETTTDYDFALIQLNGESTFAPIALNDTEIAIPSLDSQDKIKVWAAGWGSMGNMFRFPKILQKVDLDLVSTADCNSAASYGGKITDRMICAGYKAGGKDSCQLDSGGPLYMTETGGSFKLVGVVSWGEGCAQPDKFGVYSKVNAVIDWISKQTQ